jgi:hypothetical protein
LWFAAPLQQFVVRDLTNEPQHKLAYELITNVHAIQRTLSIRHSAI